MRLLLLLLGVGVWADSRLQFTEYYEGTGYDKAVEIANTGDAVHDFAAQPYKVSVHRSGGAARGGVELATGVLQPGEVVVLVHSRATSFGSLPLPSHRVVSTGALNFNGDDAVSLVDAAGTTRDLIGSLPMGSAWLKDTVLRKVASGVPQPEGFADGSDGWVQFSVGDVSGLGCIGVASCTTSTPAPATPTPPTPTPATPTPPTPTPATPAPPTPTPATPTPPTPTPATPAPPTPTPATPAPPKPTPAGPSSVDVIFSPQKEDTHLKRIAAEIDTATESVDIAMYSYSHRGDVKDALDRALKRGVKIRFLANTALAESSSKGGALEKLGVGENKIDVRRVTKIMHHKFAIIDGPRSDAEVKRAQSATVISGSANWSGSAGSIYDENTLFLKGYPELVLRLQREFDTLWAGSKDVAWVEGVAWDRTRATITDDLIALHDDPDTDALLTSYNFRPTSSKGWSVLGTWVVTDALVEAIAAAEESIVVASGHFLNTRIAQAIADRQAQLGSLEVSIVLDCQEVSKRGAINTIKEKIIENGGSIKYKCNAYKWHYKTVKQMHHKYMVIDAKTVYTGSYNWSPNSETNTFENVLVFGGDRHAPLVRLFLNNHERISLYDEEEGGVDALLTRVASQDQIPLVWGAITMTKKEFYTIKSAIRKRCGAVSWPARTGEQQTYSKLSNEKPYWFTVCNTNPEIDGGYPWPSVPADRRL